MMVSSMYSAKAEYPLNMYAYDLGHTVPSWKLLSHLEYDTRL